MAETAGRRTPGRAASSGTTSSGTASSRRASSGPGRPAQPRLWPARISAAALELVSQEGYEKLTMARLARRLGVRPSALYNHIGSKDELMLLLEDELMGEIQVEDLPHLSWQKALEALARRYLAVFVAHTPLIPVIAHLPVSQAPQALRVYEAAALILTRAGLPAEEIVAAIAAFESFIFGSSYDAGAPAEIFRVSPESDTPVFARAVSAAGGPQGEYRPSLAFEWGLQGLLDHVEKRAAYAGSVPVSESSASHTM